jgi:DNA-binding NarL/FixJ family response regulator
VAAHHEPEVIEGYGRLAEVAGVNSTWKTVTASHQSPIQRSCSVLEKFLPADFPALVGKQERKTQQLERDYRHTLIRLEQSQQDLRQRIIQLETLKQELVETNQAILALTQKIDTLRQEIKEQIMSQIRPLLFSFFEHMSDAQRKMSHKDHVSKLLQFIAQVDPAPPASLPSQAALTSQEQRIISMIRQGMTNDKIAEQLYIAPTTVKTHRRNIRKKLGLAGAKNRLQAYFQTS